MKTFRFTKEENPVICGLIFKIYLAIFLKKWNRLESYKNDVYDNYGIIDTLGDRGDIGRFTYSYSNELVSIHSIRFMGIELEYIDF